MPSLYAFLVILQSFFKSSEQVSGYYELQESNYLASTVQQREQMNMYKLTQDSQSKDPDSGSERLHFLKDLNLLRQVVHTTLIRLREEDPKFQVGLDSIVTMSKCLKKKKNHQRKQTEKDPNSENFRI